MSIASSKPADPLNPNNPNDSGEGQSSVQIVTARQGEVDLETDQATLADYLTQHSRWIERCFKPLQVYPLAADAYKLQFFRIGGLGFELEPCFGVQIWSEGDSLFRLGSIELPSDEGLPYRVQCQSSFRLEEISPTTRKDPKRQAPIVTRVHWHLYLNIHMDLPGFLQALPYSLVHRVGSKVVQQVTRNMSDRLTHNVCSDFYRWIGKPGKKYRISNLMSAADPELDLDAADF